MSPEEIIEIIGLNYCFDIDFNEQMFHKMVARLPFSSFVSECGATKGVLIFDKENFVIKIPFTQIVDDDYGDSYTNSNDEIEYNFDIVDFRGAFQSGIIEVTDNLNMNWDYCRLETAIYNKAKEMNLDIYFAKEELAGYINNYPIYIQQKCMPFSDVSIDYNSKEYETKKKISNQYCDKINFDNFNPCWIADFIEIYGEDEFEKLANFIQQYDIEDLRDCNVGYYDGAPILFDYAGYKD